MKILGRMAFLLVLVVVGCDRQGDGDLRQSYERMMAEAERRTAEQEARTPPPQEAPAADLSLESPERPGPDAPDPVEVAEPGPPVDEPAPPTSAAVVMRDARVGEHAGFDRIVFEFDGPELPPRQISYANAPIRECGSGAVVPVAGNAFLHVRFDNARAYEMVGANPRPTIENRNRTMQFGALRQFTLTCDSDGRVEWVMGVTAQHTFRVLELSVPMRLVVDVFVD